LIIFMLHPALGAFAFSCAIILILMALLNERILKTPFADSSEAGARNYKFTEMTLRNAEVVQAMGMLPGLLHRWSNDRHLALQKQSSASDRAAAVQSTIRFFRLAMQSLILGLGAFLVIEKFITVGAMFAGSILLGRALQPIEQIVGSWRTLITAKSAYRRIKQLLLDNPTPATSLELPKPLGQLCVEKLNYVAPGTNHHILKNINFELEPGKLLGIVGPSGAGKSTLSRQLIGILAPSTGAVRLDGADVSKWNRDLLGRYIGYLPQDIELFDDTVAANISRFRTESDAEVIEAARLAGVHEMILRLPSGYETQIGDNSAVLSGGYRQRIGLARAVFGNPSLVVLDEPSSNLDTDGDIALLACLTDLKRRGAAVVIISHRTNTLGVVDRLLVLKDGAAEISGPRDEVIARVTKLTKPFRNVANPLSA
jgi:PrtD family type I secretion system ABC transporter